MTDGIEIKELSVHYETLEALSLVNLECRYGQLTMLLGPNGAGKSTLIGAISGLLYDRVQRAFLTDERLGITGNILYEGKDITHLAPHERIRMGITHCPEKRRLFPEMSVIDNLLVGAFLRKDKAGTREDIEKVFALFPEIIRLKKRAAGFLSGGEQQMVAFGRALMSRPKFLLMDEPMTGLAPIVRAHIRASIFSLLDQSSIGILITEQNSKTFLEKGARIYIIGRGVIVFNGIAEDVMKDEYLTNTYFGA
ncbi:MAG: ABC transporter ATP-binding protein [Deltaproteobacteria bacterium]|nr:ABC transporter ATP-binding protein [Deltaproteobacteria bacterium]